MLLNLFVLIGNISNYKRRFDDDRKNHKETIIYRDLKGSIKTIFIIKKFIT